MQPQKDGDIAGPEVNALSPDAALHTPSIRSGRSRRSEKSDNPQQADAIESKMKPTEQNTMDENDHDQKPESCSHSSTRPQWTSVWSHGIGKTGAWLKEELVHSKLSHKIFGRAPSHRKHPRQSICGISNSSRRGSKCAHKDMQDMFQSTNNSSRSANSQFPGGEAVRVSTPPLDEDTADGKPRGFFTSMTPPDHNSNSSPSPTQSSTQSSPHHGLRRNSLASQPREWWDPMPRRNNRRQQKKEPSAEDFAFDVPEHLPSSPLCPANGRHKSGGKGVCVYHGRRRAKSSLRDAGGRGSTAAFTGGFY
ncbi:RNA polymerase II accessory factor, Cdc73 [Pochonia chlamydosporia 170]|uniref:RNA polymerase II accessory factor, Cdc73 n=1 Tax=Pochonia chlamydosporia 170 TaxID=1380566 RepID=A0A179FU59_METCM|nr:RNA polymerase II accessory factor, Cdc73 [Pochonia chlamydosporia 170]OAQ68897.1 RNA polymerase II accessory factor, Cdc73 [Pochonia chlamydosporia 170]